MESKPVERTERDPRVAALLDALRAAIKEAQMAPRGQVLDDGTVIAVGKNATREAVDAEAMKLAKEAAPKRAPKPAIGVLLAWLLAGQLGCPLPQGV